MADKCITSSTGVFRPKTDGADLSGDGSRVAVRLRSGGVGAFVGKRDGADLSSDCTRRAFGKPRVPGYTPTVVNPYTDFWQDEINELFVFDDSKQLVKLL